MDLENQVNSPEDADFIVQKLPCDMGIHRNPRKGTLNAPSELLQDFSFDNNLLISEVFPDEFDLEETHKRIEKNTKDLISYDKPLISLGGDHSVSFPVIKALKERISDLRLVWVDSHLDVKSSVDDHVSHDVVVRELVDKGLFSPEEVYFVGTTRVDSDEKSYLERNTDFNVFRKVDDFIREFEKNTQPVYVSIDIDSLTKDEAPGTGYPDGKLNIEHIQKILEKTKPLHCDLVEIAPSLDKNQKTVKNGRKILKHIEQNINTA